MFIYKYYSKCFVFVTLAKAFLRWLVASIRRCFDGCQVFTEGLVPLFLRSRLQWAKATPSLLSLT
jgi:hypothetical protein